MDMNDQKGFAEVRCFCKSGRGSEENDGDGVLGFVFATMLAKEGAMETSLRIETCGSSEKLAQENRGERDVIWEGTALLFSRYDLKTDSFDLSEHNVHLVHYCVEWFSHSVPTYRRLASLSQIDLHNSNDLKQLLYQSYQNSSVTNKFSRDL